MPKICPCRTVLARSTWCLPFALLATVPGCAPEDGPAWVIDRDSVPPAAVLDLRVSARDDSTLTLLWTAPGADGNEGRAWRYDARRSPAPIDEATWSEATMIQGEPLPSVAGRTEIFLLLGLGATERYFFSLKTEDEWGNVSDLSNVAEAEPLDRIAPGRVTDLAGTVVGPNEVELSWTATGDDGDEGRATGYVIRYARFELNAENFGEGAIVSPSPIPRESGERETFRVHLVPAEGTSVWFALQVWDEVGQSGPISSAARVEMDGGIGVGSTWERDGDRAGDRDVDRAGDRAGDRDVDRGGERDVERGGERDGDREGRDEGRRE